LSCLRRFRLRAISSHNPFVRGPCKFVGFVPAPVDPGLTGRGGAGAKAGVAGEVQSSSRVGGVMNPTGLNAFETYVQIKGVWKYLYRAVDKAGATVDFLLTAKRDRTAALPFLRKAIGQNGTPEKIASRRRPRPSSTPWRANDLLGNSRNERSLILDTRPCSVNEVWQPPTRERYIHNHRVFDGVPAMSDIAAVSALVQKCVPVHSSRSPPWNPACGHAAPGSYWPRTRRRAAQHLLRVRFLCDGPVRAEGTQSGWCVPS
jgi:hypothetical protein